jgi:hypothetical protein
MPKPGSLFARQRAQNVCSRFLLVNNDLLLVVIALWRLAFLLLAPFQRFPHAFLDRLRNRMRPLEQLIAQTGQLVLAQAGFLAQRTAFVVH